MLLHYIIQYRLGVYLIIKLVLPKETNVKSPFVYPSHSCSHTHTHTHIIAAIVCSFLYLPTPYSPHMILKAIMSYMVYINKRKN